MIFANLLDYCALSRTKAIIITIRASKPICFILPYSSFLLEYRKPNESSLYNANAYVPIEIVFDMNLGADDKTKTILKRTAMTCPVFFSLNTEIEKEISFNWK